MTRPFPFRLVVWPAVVLGLLAGCGAPSDQGSVGNRSGARRAGVANKLELPKLGDYLPPLDGGRIELAPPEGWYVPPASSKYVFRAQKSRSSTYPSVIVTAEDYQGEGIFHVSSENVGKFADQMAAALGKQRSSVKRFERGKFVGVAHAKRGQVRRPVTRIIEVLCLDTVVAGRKYRIELRSRDGSLESDQPYLFAVVEGLRFLEAGSDEKPARPPDEGEKEQRAVKERPKEEPGGEPQEEETKEPNKDGGLDLDKLDKLIE